MKLTTPVAIIIAGVLIAAAVLYGTGVFNDPSSTKQATAEPSAGINLRAVDATDHIRGSLDTPIKIVEYSDLECPFCKRFHETMRQVMTEYEGQVAWVYRHFPLDQLHSKARNEAKASECAAEQGGNDKFWAYVDRLFEITPSNNGLDPAELPKIAQFVGLDVNKFNECLAGSKYDAKIQADVDDAAKAGGRGTPYSIILTPKGDKVPIPGALPFENIKQGLDQILADK